MSNLLSWHDAKRFRRVSKAVKKSFRIWNKCWNFNLFLNKQAVGMYIDSMDSYKIWYKAKILSIQKLENKESIHLHFSGWGDEWNIKWSSIDVMYNKLAPLHTYTYNWRDHIKEGKKVEFLEKQSKNKNKKNKKRLWHVGIITKINRELSTMKIKPIYTNSIKEFTTSIASDDICDIFTHVKLNNIANDIVEKNLHLCNNYVNTSIIKQIAHEYSIGKILGDIDVIINESLEYIKQ